MRQLSIEMILRTEQRETGFHGRKLEYLSTVTSGTLEYCQTDTTAQFSSASFDGDPAWADYSIQAEAKDL